MNLHDFDLQWGFDSNEHKAANTMATIRDLIDTRLATVFARRRYNSTFAGASKPPGGAPGRWRFIPVPEIWPILTVDRSMA